MPKSTIKAKSVDLGTAQAEFQLAQAAWHKSERELARAQETRDKARARAQASDVALRDAARTVLG